MREGAGFSGSIQCGFSNLNSICALGGPFTNVSGTVGYELAGTGDYFQGSGDTPGVRFGEAGLRLGSAAVVPHRFKRRALRYLPSDTSA